jgi:pyrimidine operon attenuation protein/uracil phosphoribosyltransferase
MKILEQQQIKQKIKRLAIQILENNYGEEEIILAGINNNGLGFAKLLRKEIKKRTDAVITLANVSLNPANPLKDEISINLSSEKLTNKSIVLVDDVANTGRTLFFAFQPFMKQLVKKIEVAVLVNREHKLFPIQVDYQGISLATTIEENIDVQLEGDEQAVFIK